ncbi:hypothetical protein CCH79_00008935, partial [Gambusia affinis]
GADCFRGVGTPAKQGFVSDKLKQRLIEALHAGAAAYMRFFLSKKTPKNYKTRVLCPRDVADTHDTRFLSLSRPSITTTTTTIIIIISSSSLQIGSGGDSSQVLKLVRRQRERGRKIP